MGWVAATIEHLEILQSWFQDPDSAARWGGPDLRFPFEKDAFREDIRWGEIRSFSWLSQRQEMLGFGQYYEDQAYCRLARLAVAPEIRGQGLGRRMIAELMRIGCSDLGVHRCCLFVLEDNAAAIRCYRSLGFVGCEYPAWQERLPGVRYMVHEA